MPGSLWVLAACASSSILPTGPTPAYPLERVEQHFILSSAREAERLGLDVGTAQPPYYVLQSAQRYCLVWQGQWTRTAIGDDASCNWRPH